MALATGIVVSGCSASVPESSPVEDAAGATPPVCQVNSEAAAKGALTLATGEVKRNLDYLRKVGFSDDDLAKGLLGTVKDAHDQYQYPEEKSEFNSLYNVLSTLPAGKNGQGIFDAFKPGGPGTYNKDYKAFSAWVIAIRKATNACPGGSASSGGTNNNPKPPANSNPKPATWNWQDNVKPSALCGITPEAKYMAALVKASKVPNMQARYDALKKESVRLYGTNNAIKPDVKVTDILNGLGKGATDKASFDQTTGSTSSRSIWGTTILPHLSDWQKFYKEVQTCPTAAPKPSASASPSPTKTTPPLKIPNAPGVKLHLQKLTPHISGNYKDPRQLKKAPKGKKHTLTLKVVGAKGARITIVHVNNGEDAAVAHKKASGHKATFKLPKGTYKVVANKGKKEGVKTFTMKKKNRHLKVRVR